MMDCSTRVDMWSGQLGADVREATGMAAITDQMTARLTRCLDGPQSDDDTTAVAWFVAEAVRFLKYATRNSAGMTCPATGCTVTGELACAVARLGQLAERIGQFLARELAAGLLGDDQGSHPADVAAGWRKSSAPPQPGLRSPRRLVPPRATWPGCTRPRPARPVCVPEPRRLG